MFWRSLFVLLFFFFWSLCCLFFFDIRILITPLVSSHSSLIYYSSIEFMVTTLFLWLYMYLRVDILLTCGKHLHACISSLKTEVWSHRTSLPPLPLSACTNPETSAVMHICVRVIDFASFFDFSIGLGLGLWCLTPLSTIFQLYRFSIWFLELCGQCGIFWFSFYYIQLILVIFLVNTSTIKDRYLPQTVNCTCVEKRRLRSLITRMLDHFERKL